jgi:AcrR family transcriptional regulator
VTSPPRRATQHASRARVQPCLAGCAAGLPFTLAGRAGGQTRLAILAVATRLFAGQGWAGTGMRDVARAAGVSVETVYANFGSKAQLLKQAMAVAVVGDDEPVPLSDRPGFRALAEGNIKARAAAAGRPPVAAAP